MIRLARISLRFRKCLVAEHRHYLVRGTPGLSETSAIAGLVERVRSETLTYLKTEGRSKFTALRESLSAEDQELLILRVDRKLAWDEIARVFTTDAGTVSEDDLKKESARLRKRFQSVKARLFELGERAGLVKPR